MHSTDGNLGQLWGGTTRGGGRGAESPALPRDAEMSHGSVQERTPLKVPWGELGLGWSTNKQGLLGTLLPGWDLQQRNSWRTRENLHFKNVHCRFMCL